MSDETGGATTTEERPEPSDVALGGADQGAADEHAVVPAGGEGNFERYVVPFLIPALVIGAVLFYVLNVSRIFIALHGARASVVAVAITLTILGGASALAAAPRMRSSSLRLVVAGSLFTLMLFGTLAIGEAEEHEEVTNALAPDGPVTSEIATDSGNLFFRPSELAAETGIVGVTMTNIEPGQHNFTIEDPGIEFEPLVVVEEGDVDSGRFFVGEPAAYVYFCSVPGHRAAGMEGTIDVTGDPKTLEEALAEVGGGDGADGGGEAPADGAADPGA